MKKLIILLLSVICTSVAKAQADGSAYSIKTLRGQIENRDSIIRDIKKPRVLIDSLKSQIADYDSLTKSMDIRYANIGEVVHAYQLLTSSDTIVFHKDFKQFDVPQALKAHIALVEKIVSVRTSIEQVERKIENLTSRLDGLNVNFKQVVQEEIEQDVMKLDALITEIKGMNLSTLSKEQLGYFKPGLTERYNKFLNYFE